MASPTRDDAQLMIQIAQWGTSLGVQDAMPRIFADDFDPNTADAMDDEAVRTILMFGESLGTLTKRDLLSSELVDDWHVDVYCFGLATDFRTLLLPGAKRLFELADEINPVHVEVLCWCGRPGQLNARVVDGRVVREGDTVVVADTAAQPDAPSIQVHYQVLCRTHHRHGDLGPDSDRQQLRLEV